MIGIQETFVYRMTYYLFEQRIMEVGFMMLRSGLLVVILAVLLCSAQAISADQSATAHHWASLAFEQRADPMVCPESAGRVPFGTPRGMTVSGDILYLISGTGLMIIDISAPETPETLSSMVLPGLTRVVAEQDGLLFVANAEFGLRIINVSDPNSPVEVGAIPSSEIRWTNPRTTDETWGVAVAGDHAFITDRRSGLRIIDISDPSAPVEVSSYFSPRDWFSEVVVEDQIAYLCAFDKGLLMLDVSDPTAPTLIKSIVSEAYPTGISKEGDTIYLACGWDGVRILDVSDTTTVNEIGATFFDDLFVFHVVASGGYVYAGLSDMSYRGILQVLDVSDPSAPTMLGSIRMSGFSTGLAVSDQLVLVNDLFDGTRIIDASDPSKLAQISFLDLPSGAYDAVASGRNLYVVDRKGRLDIFDITNPVQPAALSSIGKAKNYWYKVHVAEGYAYVAAGEEGLRVFDVHDPRYPVEVGMNHIPWAAVDVAISGGYAYVAAGWAGLQVVDVSSPDAPFTVVNVPCESLVSGVEAAGEYVYVADQKAGLRVFDVSNPEDPVDVALEATRGETIQVAISGEYAYVAEGPTGICIVDISNPRLPSVVTYVPSPSIYAYSAELFAKDNLVYVGAENAGIWVVDVSVPLAPEIVGIYDTANYARRLSVSDRGYLYVADSEGGVDILNPAACSKPTPRRATRRR
jgi:hypothetical protein